MYSQLRERRGRCFRNTMNCVRRVRQVLFTGDDAIQSDGVRPETRDRIEAFGALDYEIPEPQRDHLRKMRTDCVKIVDEMYNLIKPIFGEINRQVVRPLPSKFPNGFDGSVSIFGQEL
jgi:hypothetical protein